MTSMTVIMIMVMIDDNDDDNNNNTTNNNNNSHDYDHGTDINEVKRSEQDHFLFTSSTTATSAQVYKCLPSIIHLP
jgi:hypothetical protein